MAEYKKEFERIYDANGYGFPGRESSPHVFGHSNSIRGDRYRPAFPCSKEGSATGNSASHVSLEQRRTAESESTRTHKLKVVVADDEETIADTLALILNRSGFEARAVYSGEAAVEVVDSFEPDVLISDVVMPGMTGVEAAIAVRVLQPNCKVLLFSGQALTSDLLQGARTQGHTFEIIAKPIHPTDLLEKLRTGTSIEAH